MYLTVVVCVVVMCCSVLVQDCCHGSSIVRFPLAPATLEEISGTCRGASDAFDLSRYYNMDALRSDPVGRDVSGPTWDLAKDGAFTEFTIMYCEFVDFPGYTPESVLSILQDKGLTIRRSCDTTMLAEVDATTGRLVIAVLIVVDSALLRTISDVDATAIGAYYTSGGNLMLMTNACPSVYNVNRILQSLPSPLNATSIHYNNNLYPSRTLSPGNPKTIDRFGFHLAFTGVATMTSGQTNGVPIARATDGGGGSNSYGSGIFVPLLTVPFVSTTTTPPSCGGDTVTAPATAGLSSGYPAAMYLDPLVQLASIPAARAWGRVAVDTAVTRYRGTDGTRTTSHRFGANLITWLLNIENQWSSMQGQRVSQVVGCSNGDTIRVKGHGVWCNVDFYPSDSSSPRCSSTLVTSDYGTACQLGLSNFGGSFWIIVSGRNTSIRVVVFQSLFTRVVLASWSGGCFQIGPWSLANCSTGAGIRVQWNLPTPTRGGYLSLAGPGTRTTNCSSLIANRSTTAGALFVTCILGPTGHIPRGYAQLFLDDVSTGISLYFDNPTVPRVNVVYCSQSHSKSRSHSPDGSSATQTITVTETMTGSDSFATSASASNPQTATVTVTSEASVSASNPSRSLSVSAPRVSSTQSASNDASSTTTMVLTVSMRGHGVSTSIDSFSQTVSATTTVTGSNSKPSKSMTITTTATFACVDTARLMERFDPYVRNPPSATISDSDVVGGVNVTVGMYRVPHIEEQVLHIPWFQATTCRGRVVAHTLPNQGGFARFIGRALNITVSFLKGVGASSTLPGDGKNGNEVVNDDEAAVLALRPVRIDIPPIPDFSIFEAETIDIAIAASCLTIWHLCGGAANQSSESAEAVSLFRIRVVPDASPTIANVHAVLVPVAIGAAFLAPHVASHVQTMMAQALAPCGNAYQRRVFGLRRVLVPTAASVDAGDDNVWWSAAWGSMSWIGGALLLHLAVACLTSCVRKVPILQALPIVRFPSLWLQFVYYATFTGSLFSWLQWLATTAVPYDDPGDDAAGHAGGVAPLPLAEWRARVFLVAVALVLVLVVLPCFLFWLVYATPHVAAAFRTYLYHATPSWRLGEGAPRGIRWLSARVVLPRGMWETAAVRRMFGGFFFSHFMRPERCWCCLHIGPPLLVCVLLTAPAGHGGTAACHGLLSAVAMVYAARVVVCQIFRPCISHLEHLMLQSMDVVQISFFVFANVNLAFPLERGIEIVLGMHVLLQVLLHLAVVLNHVVRTFWIDPALRSHVKSRLTFVWTKVITCGMGAGSGSHENHDDDDEEELHWLDPALEEEDSPAAGVVGGTAEERRVYRQLVSLGLYDALLKDNDDDSAASSTSSSNSSLRVMPIL